MKGLKWHVRTPALELMLQVLQGARLPGTWLRSPAHTWTQGLGPLAPKSTSHMVLLLPFSRTWDWEVEIQAFFLEFLTFNSEASVFMALLLI